MWTDRTAVLLALMGLVLAGCGVVRGADWYGEVLYTLEGQVRTDGTNLSPDDLLIAMFWTRSRARGDVQYVEARTSFPANYELRIFSPPPADAMLPLADWPDVKAAVGRPLLFVDEDNSGGWSEDDRVVGGSAEEVVVYLGDEEGTFTPDDPRPGPRLGKGFQRMRAPGRPCLEGAGDLSEPTGTQTDLIIGDIYSWFWTWECANDESDVPQVEIGCPRPADLAWACSQEDGQPGPALHACMERHCDTIDELMRLERLLGTCMTESEGRPCGSWAPDDLAPACGHELCPRLSNVPDVAGLDSCPRAYNMLAECGRRPDVTGVSVNCYALYCPIVAEGRPL